MKTRLLLLTVIGAAAATVSAGRAAAMRAKRESQRWSGRQTARFNPANRKWIWCHSIASSSQLVSGQKIVEANPAMRVK